MSSALTFYFKEIFPTQADFQSYLMDFAIADISDAENLTFANFLYKILFRKHHNSNIQYDIIDDFKFDLANKIEDVFEKYKRQVAMIKKIQNLTDEELAIVSTALANSANNPNTTIDDPTKPLEYVGAQAYTIANTGKLQAYLNALKTIPTQLIDAFLMNCSSLFKSIIPNQIYLYEE